MSEPAPCDKLSDDFICGDGQGKTITLSDIDQDGKLDLVLVSSKRQTVSVAHGYGNGTFKAPSACASVPGLKGYKISLVTGDFNGDESLDVVVAGGRSTSMLTYDDCRIA